MRSGTRRAMHLAESLTPDRIDVAFRAADKASAIDALSALLARGAVDVDAAIIARTLRERESLACTGVGEGVAFPHGKIGGLRRIVAAVAIAPEGVAFDALDGRPVRIFVALLSPSSAAGDHVRALARWSRLLSDEAVRARLLSARDADEVHRIVCGAA